MANRKSYNQYRPDTVSHPGLTLAEKIKEMDMTVDEFALRAHTPVEYVSNILKGLERISIDFSLILENVTRIPARFWLTRQRNYDNSLSPQYSPGRFAPSMPAVAAGGR